MTLLQVTPGQTISDALRKDSLSISDSVRIFINIA